MSGHSFILHKKNEKKKKRKIKIRKEKSIK